MNKIERARQLAKETKPRFVQIETISETKRIKQKHYEMQYNAGTRCLLKEQQRIWNQWHAPKGEI